MQGNPTDLIERELWKLLFPVPFNENKMVKIGDAYDTIKNKIFEVSFQLIAIPSVSPNERFKVKVVGAYESTSVDQDDEVVFDDILSIDVKRLGDVSLFTAEKFRELSYFIYSSIRTLWRTRCEGK